MNQFLTTKEFARRLRKNLTVEERIVWNELRNRKLDGYKFLRQHPIKVWETHLKYHFYFADFYCSEKRLVIEIDGLIHNTQKEYDALRNLIMTELKLHVLRFTNDQVNTTLMNVLQNIRTYLNKNGTPV